ncbi:MAG: hypothetical protein RIE73_26150 [Coleofasciculus sp. C1-SOL-03]
MLRLGTGGEKIKLDRTYADTPQMGVKVRYASLTHDGGLIYIKW